MRAWLCAAVLVGCGNGGGSGDDQTDAATDDSGMADAAGPEWTVLIERDWTLLSGDERNLCRRIMIPEDMYLTGFRALSPAGTHHEVLTISTTSTTVGNYNCSAGNLDEEIMYAGGANTNDFIFPPDVAIKLSAGSYINLNLHLSNVSDLTMTGQSGILVKKVTADQVQHEAHMIFAGTMAWNEGIAPTNSPVVKAGGCSVPAVWNVFGVWPHMHRFATHQKVEHRKPQTNTIDVILDTAYSWEEQRHYPTTFQVGVNEQVRVYCTYVNDTNVTQPPGYIVMPGNNSNDEMCYTGMYKYPKDGTKYQCVAAP